MQIAMSKTREQFPLSPKKILKKTIHDTFFHTGNFVVWSSIVFGLLLLPLANLKIDALQSVADWAKLALDIVSTPAVVVGGLVVTLLFNFVATYFYQRWYFATYFYDLTPEHLIIRKGPITPREIVIPFERIQDVYVDQDLLDRFFGLYDVHVSSATASSGRSAHIDGVEKEAADGLRAALLEMMKQRMSKEGVGFPA